MALCGPYLTAVLLCELVAATASPGAIKLDLVHGALNGIIWNATNAPTLSIQSSEDLQQWHPRVNAYSTRENWAEGGLIDLAEDKRFYRASHPAETVLAMLIRWENLGPKAYEFTFQRICFCAEPDYYRGRVTVRDGKVVAATNVITFNNTPVENPELSMFSTVEELFTLIGDRVGNAEVVIVDLDQHYYFPRRIKIDFFVSGQDDEDSYLIEDFRPIE